MHRTQGIERSVTSLPSDALASSENIIVIIEELNLEKATGDMDTKNHGRASA